MEGIPVPSAAAGGRLRRNLPAGPFLAMRMSDMRLLLALALVPAAARAVTLTVNGTHADVLIGASACSSKSLLAAWDLQQTPGGGDTAKLVGTSDSRLCTRTTPPTLPYRTFFGHIAPASQ